MEKRVLKMSLGKSGAGNLSAKLSIPTKWIYEMDITKEEREVEVIFEHGEIRIKKLDK
jgi:hypothetical protein